MIFEAAQYVTAVLLVLGAAFGLLAALGILRLPDLYTRMHAASKAGTVGTGLVLLGIMVVSFDGPVILRAVIGVLFIVLTTPISAHLLAKAAYFSGQKPSEMTKIDDLQSLNEIQ